MRACPRTISSRPRGQRQRGSWPASELSPRKRHSPKTLWSCAAPFRRTFDDAVGYTGRPFASRISSVFRSCRCARTNPGILRRRERPGFPPAPTAGMVCNCRVTGPRFSEEAHKTTSPLRGGRGPQTWRAAFGDPSYAPKGADPSTGLLYPRQGGGLLHDKRPHQKESSHTPKASWLTFLAFRRGRQYNKRLDWGLDPTNQNQGEPSASKVALRELRP